MYDRLKEKETEKMLEKFISFLKENDWKIEENDTECDVYSNAVLSAYGSLPAVFLELLRKYKSVASGDDTRLFLCVDDYSGESGLAFKWNEFELISLEAAEGDEDWTNDIRSWWKTKIPFYMSVDGEYSFYAIDTEDNGSILSGYEPEFEEADKVADSFEDFMSKVLSGDIVL